MSVPTGYQPSATAQVWSIIASSAPGGFYKLALDMFTYDSAIGPFVVYALLQQAPDGHWDFLGNMAPAQPTDGNAGKLWELNIGATVTYTPPGGATIQGNFTDICNQEQDGMCLKWLPYIKTIIDRVLFGSAPAPTPWPATTWQQAVTNLQDVIHNKIVIVGGYPVVKS